MSRLAEVTVERHPGAVVVAIAGEIDLSNVDEIRTALVEAVDHDTTGLVLDLGATTYLDSTGIRMLFELAHKMQTRRRRLRIVVTDQALVRRVIVLTQLEDRVPIDATVERSLLAMSDDLL